MFALKRNQMLCCCRNDGQCSDCADIQSVWFSHIYRFTDAIDKCLEHLLLRQTVLDF